MSEDAAEETGWLPGPPPKGDPKHGPTELGALPARAAAQILGSPVSMKFVAESFIWLLELGTVRAPLPRDAAN